MGSGTSFCSFFAILLLIGCFHKGAYATITPEEEEQIDEFVADLLQCLAIPGMNLAAVSSSRRSSNSSSSM